ncbi:MAG: protein kinase [Deltaproteobacteria bacterium]|nr:protein kinase [Deltaproteobacteria bacterium]
MVRPPTQMRDPLLGVKVGNFHLTRKLGEGGMGSVYLGEHPHIGSHVAVKFLHPALAMDPAVVRRFYSEARASNIAAHEHIVRVLDLGCLEGHGYYLMMEYIPAPTLKERMRGPMPLGFSEQVLSQLCAALADAHARGVVHRDLKPENILVLDRDGAPFVKITDFGIAKLRADAATLGGTMVGDVMGTPEYMAPEQCEGQPTDARADGYALGIIAYELVTGRTPFQGSTGQLLVAHLRHAPQPPRELRPDLPAAWNDAILRALSKRADERFPTVAAFRAALRAPGRPVTQARPPVEVKVEFAPGTPRFVLRALDLSRGGALVCFAGKPPPLLSRVRVAVGDVDLEADVVRHVSDADARAWGKEPGFAVQFRSAPATLGAAIDKLQQQPPPTARPPTPLPPTALAVDERAMLHRFSTRDPRDHYGALGLATDARYDEIISAGKRTVAALQTLEQRQLSPIDATQVQAALARVASAIAVLGSPSERLRFDAVLGNFRGVVRVLEGGISRDVVAREHAEFLRRHVDVAARVGVHLARIKIARARDNLPAAMRELEAALTAAPLDLTLHALRGELGLH